MRKILIVGAGLSGCTLARQLADNGDNVHMIEKRNHIAGNCYDFIDKNGILVNLYGAHIFHTNSDKVWTFVQRFSNWIPWKHKVIGKIKNKYFPIPVNISTVNILCNTHISNENEMCKWLNENREEKKEIKNSEEMALGRVGRELYELIFRDYTYKQWNKYPYELDKSVLERIPVRTTEEDGYFSDIYQGLPEKGYTEFVRRMINHPNITIELNKEYEKGMREEYDYLFFTGPIDQYYSSYGYEKLEYRSIRFETEYLDMDYYQQNSVVNYPSLDEPFTRIIEYKHFLNQNIPNKTTIVKEYSMDDGEPYYPVPTEENKKRYEKYKKLAENDEQNGIYFVGRLANYKYYNMDAAIENALNISEKFIQNV
jgi:UDP-galactopyranose mutase